MDNSNKCYLALQFQVRWDNIIVCMSYCLKKNWKGTSNIWQIKNLQTELKVKRDFCTIMRCVVFSLFSSWHLLLTLLYVDWRLFKIPIIAFCAHFLTIRLDNMQTWQTSNKHVSYNPNWWLVICRWNYITHYLSNF